MSRRSGWMRAPWGGEVWILIRGGIRIAQVVRFRPIGQWVAWTYAADGSHANKERFWKRFAAKRHVERRASEAGEAPEAP